MATARLSNGGDTMANRTVSPIEPQLSPWETLSLLRSSSCAVSGVVRTVSGAVMVSTVGLPAVSESGARSTVTTSGADWRSPETAMTRPVTGTRPVKRPVTANAALSTTMVVSSASNRIEAPRTESPARSRTRGAEAERVELFEVARRRAQRDELDGDGRRIVGRVALAAGAQQRERARHEGRGVTNRQAPSRPTDRSGWAGRSRSCSACSAWPIHFWASTPRGGLPRNALRCWVAPSSVAALEEQERQPVVRAGQRAVGLQRQPVVPDRVVHLPGAAEGDRQVLQDPGLLRMIAQRQPVAGDGRVVVSLALEGQGFVEIVEALRLDRSVICGPAAQETPEETHGAAR